MTILIWLLVVTVVVVVLALISDSRREFVQMCAAVALVFALLKLFDPLGH